MEGIVLNCKREDLSKGTGESGIRYQVPFGRAGKKRENSTTEFYEGIGEKPQWVW